MNILVVVTGGLLIALSLHVLLKWRTYALRCLQSAGKAHSAQKNTNKRPILRAQDVYPPVESLSDFEWSQHEPLQLRPFRPLYHLTMAVKNSDVSSLIEMDKNYHERIMRRRKLMAEHPEVTLGAYDRVKPAVDEFYSWLISTYLPTRYPSMFTLCSTKNYELNANGIQPFDCHDRDSWALKYLKSNVTEEFYPLQPPASPVEALKSVGGIVDDDCQFLLPSDDGNGYMLEGFVCCFPSGFKMSDKLGLKMRDIHSPVPHYKEKLEKSLDRYFARLEAGKFVRRANVSDMCFIWHKGELLTASLLKWTVSMTRELFNPKGNHIHEGDEIQQQEFDLSQAILRCELQTVHRLPLTKAILFSFKTYSYPLSQIRDEGSGEELATAIDGMRDGTAPLIHRYKGAILWAEQVKAFLRS